MAAEVRLEVRHVRHRIPHHPGAHGICQVVWVVLVAPRQTLRLLVQRTTLLLPDQEFKRLRIIVRPALP